jgi:hypothetical protein
MPRAYVGVKHIIHHKKTNFNDLIYYFLEKNMGIIKNCKRIVIKIGTSTLTYQSGALNLRRIELLVLEDNVPAIRLYTKCGFVKEGLKRLSHFKRGTYVNTIIMGLLKDEYSNI